MKEKEKCCQKKEKRCSRVNGNFYADAEIVPAEIRFGHLELHVENVVKFCLTFRKPSTPPDEAQGFGNLSCLHIFRRPRPNQFPVLDYDKIHSQPKLMLGLLDIAVDLAFAFEEILPDLFGRHKKGRGHDLDILD